MEHFGFGIKIDMLIAALMFSGVGIVVLREGLSLVHKKFILMVGTFLILVGCGFLFTFFRY